MKPSSPSHSSPLSPLSWGGELLHADYPQKMEIMEQMIKNRSPQLSQALDHLHTTPDPASQKHFVSALRCMGWAIECDNAVGLQQVLDCLEKYDHVHGSHANFDLRFPLRDMLRHGAQNCYPVLTDWAKRNGLSPNYGDMVMVSGKVSSVPMAIMLAQTEEVKREGVSSLLLSDALHRAAQLNDVASVRVICQDHTDIIMRGSHRSNLSNLGAVSFDKPEVFQLLMDHAIDQTKTEILIGMVNAALRTHNLDRLIICVDHLRAHAPSEVQDKHLKEWMSVATQEHVIVEDSASNLTPSSLMPVLTWLTKQCSGQQWKKLLDAAAFKGYLDVFSMCLPTTTPDQATLFYSISGTSPNKVEIARLILPFIRHDKDTLQTILTSKRTNPQTVRDIFNVTTRKMLLTFLPHHLDDPETVQIAINRLKEQSLGLFEKSVFKHVLMECAAQKATDALEALLDYHTPKKVWSELKSLSGKHDYAKDLMVIIQSRSDHVALTKEVDTISPAPPSRKKKM